MPPVATTAPGRPDLEQYRGLVDKVARQVKAWEAEDSQLQGQAKAYLQAGERETAAKFAPEPQRAQARLKEKRSQLELHEQSYDNHSKIRSYASFDQLGLVGNF